MNSEKLCAVIKAVIETDRYHRAIIESKVYDFGLHRSQHIALVFISQCTYPPKQSDLAEQLKISPAAVAVTLKKLEKSGLIKRTLDEDDSREKRIYITDNGKKILKRTKCVFEEVDSAMCRGISDEELLAFMECLLKMQNNLKELSPDIVGTQKVSLVKK